MVKRDSAYTGQVYLTAFFKLAGLISGYVFTGLLLAILSAVKPAFSIARFKRQFNRPWKDIIIYTANTIIIVFPQLLGALRYYYGLLSGKPLHNRINIKKASLS